MKLVAICPNGEAARGFGKLMGSPATSPFGSLRRGDHENAFQTPPASPLGHIVLNVFDLLQLAAGNFPHPACLPVGTDSV